MDSKAHAPVLEARNSPRKVIRLLVFCAVGIGVFAFFAFAPIHSGRDESVMLFKNYFYLLLCGACVLVMVWRLLASRNPVLTISSEGIFDKGVAAQVIPWRMVRGVSTWEQKSKSGKTVAKSIVLALDEADERQLSLTLDTRLTRGLNRRLGADGLVIAPGTLDVDYDQIIQAITRYVETARNA